jgi:Fe-S-cluster containining protein
MLAVMGRLLGIDRGDLVLTGELDAALADAVRKCGSWLVCRPGCFECCLAPFGITQLDAYRLRRGLAALAERDPSRASRVRERARATEARLAQPPCDAPDIALAGSRSSGDEPCPVLDPETGCCDLYEARPVICRTFGPPVHGEYGSVAVCEKCFQGATDDEIAACSTDIDSGGMEARLISTVEKATGLRGTTIVAACLTSERSP